MKALGVASIFLAVVGPCSMDASAGVDGGSAGSAGGSSQPSKVIPLIGAETCQLDPVGYWVRCTIPDYSLSALPLDSAVPVRTVLRRNMSGNCSGTKNPRLRIEQADEPAVLYSFLSEPSATVRRRDAKAIAALSIKDDLPAETAGIRVAQDCRVTLEVVFNEPDVNSKAEAQALLAQIEADYADKIRIRDRYEQLLKLDQAVVFLRKVGDYLLTELTAPQMNDLRTAALDADSALLNFLTSCNSGVSEVDRANLAKLYSQLWVLGQPDEWRNTDGSQKTLADFLGSDAHKILASIDTATRSAMGDAGVDSNLQAEAQAAALDAERAAARVTQAKIQLAGWLQ